MLPNYLEFSQLTAPLFFTALDICLNNDVGPSERTTNDSPQAKCVSLRIRFICGSGFLDNRLTDGGYYRF
jgi:hypothetical protein